MNSLKVYYSEFPELEQIHDALQNHRPLTRAEGIALYRIYPLEAVRLLANSSCLDFHQNQVFYNRNIHLEPTNKCVYSCKFCAFYRKPKATEAEGAWDYSLDDVAKKLEPYQNTGLTEVHVTGGVHPHRSLDFWAELIHVIKSVLPGVHVKAYTAVEIAFMSRLSKKTVSEVLSILKDAGLDSLPGGGAEIFNPEVRKKIAGGKAPSHEWLKVHQRAHELGISSNATLLYGHVESIEDRIDHMLCLRELQDKTQGFNSFIPLKFRNENNALSGIKELSEEEDLRNYAVSRLMLQNIPHLKAYWVMIGLETAQKSLHYGVDDLDGTVNDSTRIYSMAGSMEHPDLNSEQLKTIIRKHGKTPVERNSLYETI